MKSVGRYAVAVLVLSLAFTSAARAEVKVFAQVESNADIYAGERFNYYIVIDGGTKAADRVDLVALAQYNPRSAGNRSFTNIVNGQTSMQYMMVYSLTAGEAGRKTLGPVTVTVDGRQYQTNAVEVNIIKPDTTDRLDVEMELSEEKCYVGQPVVMMMRVYFAADIQGPQFSVPVLRDDGFEFDDVDAAGGQLREYDLGVGSTMLGRQYQTSREGKALNALEVSKVLIPKRSGQVGIAPVSFSANLPVGRRRTMSVFDNQYEYKRFMVSSEAKTLAVLPVPEEGKPKGFYGLVGRYEISASAKPTQVNVGDPITLTIRIGGSEYLKSVQWPELEAVGELATNFRIPSQKASPAIEAGVKVFTQTIRANNDKVTRIPGIPLAFFDPDKGEYSIVETKAIPLEVAPTKVLTSADLEGSGSVPVNREVEAIKKGLSANYESLDALENIGFSPAAAMVRPVYAAIWGVPLLGLMASCVLKVMTQSSPEKKAARVRRQAWAKAQKELKKAASVSEGERHLSLAAAMKQYIGERFGRNAASLTPLDCYDSVVETTGDEEVAARYRDIVEQCEEGRYAASSVEVGPAIVREVSELIKTIDKKSKR